MKYEFTIINENGGKNVQVGNLTVKQRFDIEAVIDGRLASAESNEHAFPRRTAGDGGMSLRDYFAAQALIGLGTWAPDTGGMNPSEIRASRARWAYAQAEAMMAARKAP